MMEEFFRSQCCSKMFRVFGIVKSFLNLNSIRQIFFKIQFNEVEIYYHESSYRFIFIVQ